MNRFTDEQIERAAQALYASATEHPGVGGLPWEHIEWDSKQRYRRHAAAVLATVEGDEP